MEISDSLALIASRIRVAWEAGRIGRFVAVGRLDAATELRLAFEAEGAIHFFAPCLRSRSYDRR